VTVKSIITAIFSGQDRFFIIFYWLSLDVWTSKRFLWWYLMEKPLQANILANLLTSSFNIFHIHLRVWRSMVHWLLVTSPHPWYRLCIIGLHLFLSQYLVIQKHFLGDVWSSGNAVSLLNLKVTVRGSPMTFPPITERSCSIFLLIIFGTSCRPMISHVTLFFSFTSLLHGLWFFFLLILRLLVFLSWLLS
jgi:hypothetical protein